MKKHNVFGIIIFVLFLYSLPSYAHSGKTDAYGGHYNKSTGEYHYHHGYGAHNHINGECPYDFDDKTNHNKYNFDGETDRDKYNHDNTTNHNNYSFDNTSDYTKIEEEKQEEGSLKTHIRFIISAIAIDFVISPIAFMIFLKFVFLIEKIFKKHKKTIDAIIDTDKFTSVSYVAIMVVCFFIILVLVYRYSA